ncbi:hypothetical protein [Haloferax mucosum]|uniref:hypothetical protein n=1 Tax=Haloferax mucosum TaxID=403181 RepID=UPI00145EB1E7|nr:hypothetical protein [Haloferax mucosum]
MTQRIVVVVGGTGGTVVSNRLADCGVRVETDFVVEATDPDDRVVRTTNRTG